MDWENYFLSGQHFTRILFSRGLVRIPWREERWHLGSVDLDDVQLF